MKTHSEHAEQLRAAFPRHPFLVLRALRYIVRVRAHLPVANGAYNSLLVHANHLDTKKVTLLRRGDLVSTTAPPRVVLRELAVRLKGLPVGAKLP
jgi:hypothetical protein